MSGNVLSYAPVTALRASRAAGVSLWMGGVAHALFMAAVLCYDFFALPALHAGDSRRYHFYKMWFGILPGWTTMALALVGVILAIVALAKPARKRRRAIVGLVLCLAAYAWMVA